MIERTPQRRHPLIAEQPGVNDGYPTIVPTRIAVRLVVDAYQESHDLNVTCDAFPQLSREQVEAALAYFGEYPERVLADRERNARALDAIRSR